MIKNSYNDLYIGVSDNPTRRLSEHNTHRGSRFTEHSSTAFKVVFLEGYSTLAEARRREIQLKKWSRKKKDFLVSLYKQGFETKKI